MKKMAIALLAFTLVFGTSSVLANSDPLLTDTEQTTEDPTNEDPATNDDTAVGEEENAEDEDLNDDSDESDNDDEELDDDSDESDNEDEELDDDSDESASENDDEDEDEEKGNGKGKEKQKKKSEKAKKGLEQALENIKGTPAEAVVQSLLDTIATAEDPEDTVEELEQVLEDLEELGEIDEVDAELIEVAAELLYEVKESDSTKDKKDKALKALTKLFLKNQKLSEAEEAQESLLELSPEDLALYEQLGEIYAQSGKKGIKAFVNGKKLSFDAPPVIKSNRTLVPVRAISEALDAEVNWDQDTLTVTITRDDISIQLTVGSNVALVNGEEVVLDTESYIDSSRTYVPIRFIMEALNAEVDWVQTGEVIVINDGSTSTDTSETTDSTDTTDTQNTDGTETSNTEEATTEPAN